MFLRTVGFVAFLVSALVAYARDAEVLRRFDAPEAVQGVAVDGHAGEGAAFYAIANGAIGKYDKRTGKRLGGWRANDDLPLRHLNAGVVRDGRLYCAHSNFPQWPETSSVEVFDTATLRHIDSHSFGIDEGSLTWIDWRDDASEPDGGAWWAGFAHYSQHVNDNPRALPTPYTSLVKLDSRWRRLAGWVFPPEVLNRFAPHSSSGGGWGPGGLLSATGHDRPELYLLALPRCGSTLRLVETVALPIQGQAIAWDRSDEGVVYGIDRSKRQVIACRVTTPTGR
ncbi:hypothetical protein Pla108_22630 [Botrimarina colliarenosi]|uniref:Glutamine cyclotransferase n=2 Tax=Botrimarina colliarenosi TaxID=2528001 RepID=A0A5C6AFA5_9BACT|nr:hypothetical protein Pla108_22630 [Botrimarina colliarenosi]